MPDKKDLKLDQYGIGKYTYRELHNFCLQYPEKKRRLRELENPYSGPKWTGLPSGGVAGDPTGRNAERAAVASADIDLIERTASLADKERDARHCLGVYACKLREAEVLRHAANVLLFPSQIKRLCVG